MTTALLDLAFQLPEVKPLEKPMAFTGAQLQALMVCSNSCPERYSPQLQQVLQRVKELRGSSITWGFGLRLGDLITWSVKMARGSVASLPAPLVFFKPEKFLWIPKVIIRVCRANHVDRDELTAYHTTCRRASMEFMCITEEHITEGYLERRDFKRAFNGAFFCDRLRNTTIFCATVRDLGIYAWPAESHFS